MVKTFLENYSSQNGMPLPGRTPQANEKCILLPSDKNKSDIYELYCGALDRTGQKQVGPSTFRKIWLEQCPYLLVMKPATDLCLKCQKHVENITKSGNITEEEKQIKLENYQKHLEKVKCQRDHYREQCERTKLEFDQFSDANKKRGQRSKATDATVHYSFDYSQQVFYPQQAQAVGPMYFKTPRKCQCFGVCCESSGTQIFYLVDEAFQSVGKGANSVTSMLHHHFSHLGYGERNVVLHMDNCSGQNKNNAVIGYGMWRVLTGLHDSIEFSNMEAGHTKFSPDWHFGLWKVRWRNTTVNTLEDVVETVRLSSRNGHNIPHLVQDPENPVQFYNWTEFLKPVFKPIPNLLSYHHFRMTSDKPGIVYVRRYASDAEEAVKILKKDSFVLNGMPPQLEPLGLSAERQWYLHD
ncbi:uncharacterized protein LOC127848671 [Dreissena polymorpha]|nr:uncharacterized protein LOC127848671 [Dreissena polymorpha]